ncbi:MAG: tRNA pseudouridine(38-40) synthase TruA [Anaerolineaceae bacterium]|nr:tRNA pseudouridine(38-40) synthase TruA [Anaerolineaceae bacterium]
MARYKLILAYDGTAYNGYQRQAIKHSVQHELEMALRKIGWQGKTLTASGRTDSGVHAQGQVLHFDLDWKHSTETLLTALNAFLPDDIGALQAEETDASFHARYSAKSRTYCYQLYVQKHRNPLVDRFAWRVTTQPDLALMALEAKDLLGEHDFIAFGRALNGNGTTIRRIYKAEWAQTSFGMAFTITGNAFLNHMVRRIVWALVQVGSGFLPRGTVNRGFETGYAGTVALAPARGLTLMKVDYSEENEC